MTHATIVLLLTVGLFLGMLLFLEIGRRARLRRLKEDRETSPQGISSIDGAYSGWNADRVLRCEVESDCSVILNEPVCRNLTSSMRS